MISSCLVCVYFPLSLVIIGLRLHGFPFASTKPVKMSYKSVDALCF